MTDIATLRALDEAHVIHPHRPVEHPDTVIVDRGQGCLIWDVEGREYLDATAGLAVTHVGHAHPALVAAATEQLGRLEYYPSFWEYGNPRAIELAARLAGLAPGRPGK